MLQKSFWRSFHNWILTASDDMIIDQILKKQVFMASSSSSSASPTVSNVSHPLTPPVRQKTAREIYDQKVQLIVQKQNLFLNCGTAAISALAWGLILPNTALAVAALLVSSYAVRLILSQVAKAMGWFELPPNPFGNSKLESMPRDHFTQLAPFLSVHEIAQLPASRSLVKDIVLLRAKVESLDLVLAPSDDTDFLNAIALHPNITSLSFDIDCNLSPSELRKLGRALKNRQLQSLIIPPECFVKDPDLNQAGTEFLRNLNFTKMQNLSFPVFVDPTMEIFQELGPKLQNSSLKNIEIIAPACKPLEEDCANLFLKSLPPTVEHLKLGEIQLNNDLVDVILHKFNSAIIRSCNLNFSSQVNEEKMNELAAFLPFSTMTEITLRGKFITEPFIQQLALKLAENRSLEHLSLRCHAPDIYFDSLMPVLQSLHSIPLRYLKLYTLTSEQKNFQRDAFRKYTLILQSATWSTPVNQIACKVPCLDGREKLSNLRTAPPTLSEARAFFDAKKSLDEQIDAAKENVPAVLSQKKVLLTQLEAQLSITSREKILNHYAELHNGLTPSHPIESKDTLTYYGQLQNPPEVLIGLEGLDLIQRLEDLHKEEAQRLGAEDPGRGELVQLKLLMLHTRQKLEQVQLFSL